MSNPVLRNHDVFGEPRRGRGAVAAPPVDPATLEQMYAAPAATVRETGRLTYDDVVVKTGGLLALLVAVAAVTWNVAPQLWWVGMLVGLVLGLVNSFKREPSRPLIVAYAVAEGVFLGGISYVFQGSLAFAGGDTQPIVLQAVFGTFATFAAALLLFSSGKVRVTPKFTRWLLVALGGYLIFSLANLVLVWTGVLDGFGMRGGALGVVIGLVAIGLAAASLIVDFDAIKRGVEQGVSNRYAWTAAFGLLVTLVWLYLEILRLLAILNSNE